MNYVALFMLIFAVLGAVDRMLGNRFGLGVEFERGFILLGTMALSMIGMIVLSPVLAEWLQPVFSFFSKTLHMEPSIIPATLFANDMGGAPLAMQVAVDEKLGSYNALVVSSMMGATISFTIPFSLGVVKEQKHADMFLGFLYGIVTIPVGCLVSGLVMGLPILPLLWNLLPLLLFSAVIAVGLWYKPSLCVKIFEVMGHLIMVLITFGLILGGIRFITGFEVIKGLDTLENGAAICLNASAVLCGAFPFMFVLSKVLRKPLAYIGTKLNIDSTAALGLLSTLATNATSLEMINRMDRKGAILNAAFAVSAAFTFGGHLAFTLAFDGTLLLPVIVGKLVAGACALLLAILMCRREEKALKKECEG